jgi:hypothetical protein
MRSIRVESVKESPQPPKANGSDGSTSSLIADAALAATVHLPLSKETAGLMECRLLARQRRREKYDASRSVTDPALLDTAHRPLKGPVKFSLAMLGLLLLIGTVTFIRNEYIAPSSSSSSIYGMDISEPQHSYFGDASNAAWMSMMNEHLLDSYQSPHQLLEFNTVTNDTGAAVAASGCPPSHSMGSIFNLHELQQGAAVLPALGVLVFLAALTVLQMHYWDPLARWIAQERGWSTREGESLALNFVSIVPQLFFQGKCTCPFFLMH